MKVVRRVLNRTVKPGYLAARALVTRRFERRAGIETAGIITPEQLGLSPEHRGHYEPSRWLSLRRILPAREVGSDDVFIDLGSGMGRVVYQAAAWYSFRRVIGVELSERLHAIAEANIRRDGHRFRSRDIQLICADVLEYEIPDDVTVVYMYNPFTGPILASMLDRLLASAKRNPRRLRLIYANPIEEAMVLAAGFRCTRKLRGLRPGAEWSRNNSVRLYEFSDDVPPSRSNRDHWENMGAAYAREWEPPARNQLGRRELEFILAGLRASPGFTALDIGIGNGRILDGLLRGTSETEFWGVDLAQAMIDATRGRFLAEPRVRELRLCDVSRDPLPFGRDFDFVSAIRMLKYNENWRDVVAKLAAQLSPGGVIAFSMLNVRSLNVISRPYAIAGHYATRDDMRRLCVSLGLEVLEEQGFTKLPHLLYSRARSRNAVRATLALDGVLERLIGGPALSREVFIVARRS